MNILVDSGLKKKIQIEIRKQTDETFKVVYPPNISDYESKKGNIRKIGFHKTP